MARRLTRHSTAAFDDGSILDFLHEFKQGLKKPMMKGVGQLVIKYVQQCVANNFVRQEDSRGMAWQGLSDRSMKERGRDGFGVSNPMLIRTREMFDEATQDLKLAISGDVISVTPSAFGATSQYKWDMHNRPASDLFEIGRDSGDGEKSSGGVVPGREFFYIHPSDKGVIAETIVTAIVAGATSVTRGRVRDVPMKQELQSLRKSNASLIKEADMQTMALPWIRLSNQGSSIR